MLFSVIGSQSFLAIRVFLYFIHWRDHDYSIGYVARTFAVRDISNIPDTVFLADDVVQLSEVVVKPQRIKHRIIQM